MHKTTIAVDFDGVVHRYRNGWHDGTIYDEPVEGSLEAIRYLMEERKWNVFILTSREPVSVVNWLAIQFNLKGWTDIFVHVIQDDEKFWNPVERPFIAGTLGVTNRKLPADRYVDDRGITFVSWNATLPFLEADIEYDDKVG